MLPLIVSILAEAAPAAADSAALFARAQALRPVVSAGDAATLWPLFDEGMRGAMKDSASFAARMAGIHGATGAIDSVLTEEMVRDRGRLVYRALCRFERLPGTARLTISFAPDGRIAGLGVRPEELKAHESAFLEYQTKAALRLPFEGEWLVFWGGRTLEQNYHAPSRSQRFAHDLVIVKDGRTHSGDGKRLEDYYSYGQPVLAPAGGTVVWLEDGHPDQAIGSRDPAHPTGNSVIIDHGGGEYSLLAHFQPGSLKVKKGDPVRAGQVIARCGNSGNTSEPHIHYHLQNGPAPGDADGLPAQFVDLVVDGRDTTRAELVRGQQVRRKGAR